MGEFESMIDSFASIKVIGVGGGGNNAVNRMIGIEYKELNLLRQTLMPKH